MAKSRIMHPYVFFEAGASSGRPPRTTGNQSLAKTCGIHTLLAAYIQKMDPLYKPDPKTSFDLEGVEQEGSEKRITQKRTLPATNSVG